MIILNIFLTLLMYIFLFILVLIILLMIIPFSYKAKGDSTYTKSVSFYTGWFFELIGYSGCYSLNKGYQGLLTAAGFKIKITENDEKVEKNNKENIKKIKKRKRKKSVFKNFNINVIKYVIENFKKILTHILPRKIEGYGRIGFEDPYYTGIACATVESLRGLHNLNINYEFCDEVYEGEFYIEGKIILAYFVYIAIRLYLNKDIRKLLF